MKLAKFVKLWAFEALCLPCQQRGEVTSPYFYGEHPKRSTSKVGHSEILKYGQTYILRTYSKREKPTESFTFSLLVFVALTRGQEMQICVRLYCPGQVYQIIFYQVCLRSFSPQLTTSQDSWSQKYFVLLFFDSRNRTCRKNKLCNQFHETLSSTQSVIHSIVGLSLIEEMASIHSNIETALDWRHCQPKC